MKREIWALGASALLGLPAGLVWLLWAEPAHWLMTERGLVMTQELARGQFNVVATFAIIGAAVGLLVGVAMVVTTKETTWRLVPAAVGGSLLAAGTCWLVGYFFGPSNPSSATGVAIGELVPVQFVVDAWPAFLAWPLGAVFMVTVAIYMSDDPQPGS